jgi:hypothetical protein
MGEIEGWMSGCGRAKGETDEAVEEEDDEERKNGGEKGEDEALEAVEGR